MTKFKRKLINTLQICLIILFNCFNLNAQFSSGNIVVLQVSDGVATFTSTGNSVVLREYSPGGSATFSLNVPSTGTNALIVSGAATSEGGLSLSANNNYLVFTGYAQSLPNATSLASSSSSLINRGIGILDASGNYTRVSTNPIFHSGGNIRSAASDGLNNYWSAGSNEGTNYYGTANPTVNIQNTNTNTRCIMTSSNNLYFSTGSGIQGIYKIGNNYPLTVGQSTSVIISVVGTGTGTPSPYAFYFNPTQTICYVADDRSITNGGGFQKWVNAAGSWTLAYTLNTGSNSIVGARGVIADFSGANPIVFGTTADAANNRIVRIVDAGSNSTATTIVTSTTNAIFRGIAFSPCSNAPSISLVTSNGSICANQTLSLTVNATSAASYSWNGSGVFSSPTSSSSSVTGAITGNYTVTAFNGCGSTNSIIAVIVLPSPNLSVVSSASTICAGQALTLTASGANTYTWSNGIINGVVFNPTVSATYTVIGNGNSCNASSTITINVNPLPSIVANSITICSGQQGTLSASGAITYTWSNNSNSSSLVITPSVTTNYSVTATSSLGCINNFTTQVVVTNSPAITVYSTSICAGNSATLMAGGANTFTWSNGALTNSIIVTPLVSSGYTVLGSLAGCPGIAVGTTTVLVNPLPVVTVSGNSLVCLGSSISQTLSGANSYSINAISTASILTLTPTVTTNYTFIALSLNGCSASIVKNITVATLPIITISGSSFVCNGSSITQTLLGASSYSLNGTSTGTLLTLSPITSTVFIINGVNTNGCSSSINNSITVNALPSLSLTSSSPTICVGKTVTLTASGANLYTWAGNGTGSSIVVTPTASITYSVVGKSVANCTVSASITQNVELCTSISEGINYDIKFSIYPNPTSSNVKIDFDSKKVFNLQIINLVGTLIHEESHIFSGTIVDIGAMAKGIYFMKLSSGDEIFIKKLIKE